MNNKRIKLFICDVDGVLTDGGMYYSDAGCVMKRFHVQDGLGVKLLQQWGVDVAIITSDETPIVLRRAERLGIRHVFIGVHNKLGVAKRLCQDLNYTLEETAYIGDDLQDLSLAKQVGIAISVKNAHPLLRLISAYVCQLTGGNGAFREAVEWLIQLEGGDIELIWNSIISNEDQEVTQ